MKKQIVLGLIATMLMSPSAFAVKEGGGADAVQCGGFSIARIFKWGAVDGKWYRLADLEGSEGWGDTTLSPGYYRFLTLAQAKAGTMNYLKLHSPDGQEVQDALNQLHFVTVDTLPDLNTGLSINSDGEKISGCKKAQVAVQDFKTNNVYMAGPIYDQLGPLDQALLEVHEAYIYIAHKTMDDLPKMESYARTKVGAIYADNAYQADLVLAYFSGKDQTISSEAAKKVVLACANNHNFTGFHVAESDLDGPFMQVDYKYINSEQADDYNSFVDCEMKITFNIGYICSQDAYYPDASWNLPSWSNNSAEGILIFTFQDNINALARSCWGAINDLPSGFPTDKQVKSALKIKKQFGVVHP